jgi:DNA-binding response OmpR family regulator
MPEVTSLQQVQRTQLHGHLVQHSDVRHLIIIDGVIVPCTLTEYHLLVILLYHAGEVVPFARLLTLPEEEPLSRGIRRRLTQQVSRLRARLWPFDLDILCLTGYGYLLLSRSLDQSAQTAGR